MRFENVKFLDGMTGDRGLGYRGAVETQFGQRYRVYGRACGLPGCQCDAEIRPLVVGQ